MFTTGLGAGLPAANTLDDRTAQALGFETVGGFTIPTLSSVTGSSDSKMMLYIGVAGLALAVLTYFKKGR